MRQDDQDDESAGQSKVAAMVDRLQQSLATQKLGRSVQKPITPIEGPSSSSPLPEVGAADAISAAPAASPVRARHSAAPPVQHQNVPEIEKGIARQVVTLGKQWEPQSDSEEPRQAQQADSVIPAPLHLQSKAPLPAYKRPSISRTTSVTAQQRQVAVTQCVSNLPVVNEELDEFDDDLELSAEDLEELMTQPPPLDQRPLHQIPPHPDPPPQHQFAVEQQMLPSNSYGTAAPLATRTEDYDNEDDEYGCDDIDEASLAQAELSATQAYMASLSNDNVLCMGSR